MCTTVELTYHDYVTRTATKARSYTPPAPSENELSELGERSPTLEPPSNLPVDPTEDCGVGDTDNKNQSCRGRVISIFGQMHGTKRRQDGTLVHEIPTMNSSSPTTSSSWARRMGKSSKAEGPLGVI